MRVAVDPAVEGKRPPRRFYLRMRKRYVVRAGLGIVIALLLFSTTKAYRIQEALSKETLEIYHRHVKQDDLLWRLRRTLWYGANSSRDFLLNPHSDRVVVFQAQLEELRKTSSDLLSELAQSADLSRPPIELKTAIEDYWVTLEAIPAETANLNAAERYEFIQSEIVSRRAAVGNLVRKFTEVTQNSLKDSEMELSRSRQDGASRLLWVLSFSVLVALAVAGISLAHSESLERQAAERYEEVEHARTELQQFAVRLMQIQEEERTRLSHELHDEIGQALATLRLEVSRAESVSPESIPETRERLARARELAERTVDTVRDISALLRPSLLDDLGLEPALEWQVEDFTRRTRVPCQLRNQGAKDRLPEAVRTCVYRVIQESLHNCEKYASASEVSVSIAQSKGLLTVIIEDDGKGITEPERRARRSGGFGILGMRERAASLGGSLEVSSEPGQGVRVILSLPIEEQLLVEGTSGVLEVPA